MSERERESGKNIYIQQNHANAPPTWVQHTLEIEDDQDKGSQASGQHHPANSVHPHHFQQRRLHGFVLAAGTGVSGRRARGAGAGTLQRGAESRRRRAGLGRARGGGTIGRASRPLAEPAAPGRGMEGGGVALEVPRCVDPPAARSCSSCRSSPPPRRRLRSRRRPPRCLLAGRAAGERALMVPRPPLRWPLWLSAGPPPSSPKPTSLRSNDLYIPGWVLPNATRSPRRGEGARGEPGGGRDPSAGAERRAPPAPARELVASSCFPGSAEPRSRRVPKALSPRPGSAAVWRLCQRFHDKTRRKKMRIKSPRCCHPLLPAFVEGSGSERVGHRERKGVWWSAIISDPCGGGGGGSGSCSQPPGSECPSADAQNGRFRFFFQTTAWLERRFGKEFKTADFGSRLGKLH